MNKKGQWARAQMRERRSAERRGRVYQTFLLKKSKKSTETIARELGVSPNTVKGYLREIKDNPKHYAELHKKILEEEKKHKKELLRKKNRTYQEIFKENLGRSLKWGLVWTVLLYAVWWIPSIIIFVFSNSVTDITNWVYGTNFFLIWLLISIFLVLFFTSKEHEEGKRFR